MQARGGGARIREVEMCIHVRVWLSAAALALTALPACASLRGYQSAPAIDAERAGIPRSIPTAREPASTVDGLRGDFDECPLMPFA
jgi:hypothetical protein